jgi:RluA family pseudouridine synthase
MKKLNIIYEDKELLVVDKESHQLTIATEKRENNTLYSEASTYVKKQYPKNKVFIVHRLDKDTSGLVIFAKDEKVKKILQDNWDSTIRKYYALVHGQTNKSGEITSYIKETKTLYSYSTKNKSGSFAKTLYKKVKSNKLYTLLDIEIKTGKKNQIRVHMKDNNTPILGDKKYGKKDGFRRMALNAYYLCFNHPIINERIEIDTGVPKDFVSIMNNVK